MDINAFPTEILREILLETAITDNFPAWKHGPSRTPSATEATRLASVCFQWRDIVINTPKMWSHVVVDFIILPFPPAPPPGLKDKLASLDLQLQRSKTHLLDVSWNVHLNARYAKPLFEVIQARGAFCRWRTLIILGDNSDRYIPLSIREEGRFDNLISLSVCVKESSGLLPIINRTISSKFAYLNNNSHYVSLEYFLKHFSNFLPRVTEIHLPCFDHGSYPNIQLPSNITTATMSKPWDAVVSHLEQLRIRNFVSINKLADYDWSKLKQLDVKFSNLPPHHDTLPHISFPALHTLTVREDRFEPLRHIKAPRLEHLRFDWDLSVISKLHHNFDALISDMTFLISPLKVLDIGIPLTEALLTKVLSSFPNVEVLKLTFDDFNHGREVVKNVLCDKGHLGILGALAAKENVPLEASYMKDLVQLELKLNYSYSQEQKGVWRVYISKVLKGTWGKRLKTIRCSWHGNYTLEVTRSTIETQREES